MRTTLDTSGLSARNRRLLALGVRGGDGDDPPALEALLGQSEGRADLNDDDLVALTDQLRAEIRALLEDPTDDSIAAAQQARQALADIAGEQTTRQEAADERAAQAAAILAEIDPEPGEGEGESGAGEEGEGEGETPPAGDGGEGEGEGEGEAPPTGEPMPEPIAAARRTVVQRVDARRARTRPQPRPETREFVLRASANVPGIPAGQELDNDGICHAFEEVLRASGGYRGAPMNVPIMSVGAAMDPGEVYGEERTLRRDAQENDRKIAAITGLPALRASGGICAPQQVNYDVPFQGTDATPVRDEMLARFGAVRGGIRVFPPVLMSQVTGAIGVWTEANDQTPSDPTTKPCLTMTCPSETTAVVDAITQCMKIGNFRDRFFPEQIRAWTEMIAVYAARFRETRWLTKIGTASTQVTVAAVGGTGFGTTRDVLAAVDRAAAQIRSYFRLAPDYPLRLGLPDWLGDNMRVDLSREQPGASDERLAIAEATFDAWFRIRNINVTWTLDGESGQVFGAQVDGAAVGWPSHVIGYLFPEGSWLHLDGGSLDFGIVRDSVLNATNDFQVFSETFENVFFHGIASYRLDIDICPSGVTQLPKAIDVCPAGS